MKSFKKLQNNLSRIPYSYSVLEVTDLIGRGTGHQCCTSEPQSLKLCQTSIPKVKGSRRSLVVSLSFLTYWSKPAGHI